MVYRVFVAVLVIFALMPVTAIAAEKPGGLAPWGYTGAGKPTQWGTLDPQYHTCGEGQKQSPINIDRYRKVEGLPPLILDYKPSALNIMHTGHTLQVNCEGGSTLTINDKVYTLQHFHFHTPSEHYLDGAPYPMEVHFVHRAADGQLAVVGVMMKLGEHNKLVEAIWQNAPAPGGHRSVEAMKYAAADLLPAELDYYFYEGSLTMPPCTEGVQWHVLQTPIEISENQLRTFQNLFPINARPIQELHGRVVIGD